MTSSASPADQLRATRGRRDAKREGMGVYTFHNGDCYLGQYHADLPNGLGVYLFDKGQQYMGEWQSGKKHGLCVPGSASAHVLSRKSLRAPVGS